MPHETPTQEIERLKLEIDWLMQQEMDFSTELVARAFQLQIAEIRRDAESMPHA